MSKSVYTRKLASFLCHVFQAPRILLYKALSNNNATGRAICSQPMHLVGLGEIRFGDNVHIGAFPSPAYFSSYAYIEARNPGASVFIGGNTRINNNFCAIADHTRIQIGNDCLIGSHVEILDSDFHGLSIKDRGVSRPESSAPVSIGNNVFIGNNAKIMKGVTIGDGAVVANGALVVSAVSAHTLVAGVPARTIRAIQ